MTTKSTHRADNIALTVDTLIFSVSSTAAADTRRLSDKHLSILLVRRTKAPFVGQWCLPGGFMKHDETLEGAAERVLIKETNLHDIYKEQLSAFSNVDRDPRERIVSVAFISLVDKARMQGTLSDDAAWFTVRIEEDSKRVRVELLNDNDTLTFSARKKSNHDMSGMHEYDVEGDTQVAFDHSKMILMGLENLRYRAESTDVVFNMMPKEFTIGELQQVYETILGRTLWVPAFRRTIAQKVTKTSRTVSTGGHRPAALYRYNMSKKGGAQ